MSAVCAPRAPAWLRRCWRRESDDLLPKLHGRNFTAQRDQRLGDYGAVFKYSKLPISLFTSSSASSRVMAIGQVCGRVTTNRYSRTICRLILSGSWPWKARSSLALAISWSGAREMREFTKTLVSMNIWWLNPVLVYVLPPETQAFRSNCRGVDGPHFVKTELANDLWAFPPSEQQRLRTHIYLSSLPSGDTPGKGLTVAVADALIRPPGPVKACGRGQIETYDRLDLAEGGPPLLSPKAA